MVRFFLRVLSLQHNVVVCALAFLVFSAAPHAALAAEERRVVPGQYIMTSSSPMTGRALGQGPAGADTQIIAASKRAYLVSDGIPTAKAQDGAEAADDQDGVPYDAATHSAFCEAARRNNPDLEVCEPNYVVSASLVPNDTSYGSLWGLDKISAPAAWELSTGAASVVVAVVDTGIDYTHPDLASNMWRNTAEVAGDSIDNDANGYVDDIYGINSRTGSGDPYDDNGHGTHCAGTIGATGNNGQGIAGVAWNVRLMGLKFLASNGSGTTYHAISAIDYAVDNGADVISASWGGTGYSQALYDSIERAKDAGVLFVAAAGNSSSDNDALEHYPSGYALSNIISVAASDRDDNLAYFSNYGETSVDVAAPGVGIYSTYPGGSYATLSGTSMAAPHVAGLAALAMSLHTTESFSEIRQRILNNGDALDSLTGLVSSNRRIDAYGTLTGQATGGAGSGSTSIVSFPGPITLNRRFDALLSGEASSSVDVSLTVSGFYGQETCSLGTVTFDESGVLSLDARLILSGLLKQTERATLTVGSSSARRRVVRASGNRSYARSRSRRLSQESSRYAENVAESCARILATMRVN